MNRVRLALAGLLLAAAGWRAAARAEMVNKIDRHALVERNSPTLNKVDPLSPFTVGNGNFCFTADVTGLQTIPEAYEKGIPLCTMSNWGWHAFPNDGKYKFEQTLKPYDTYGWPVTYAADQKSSAAVYLRSNPQRVNLARIGFCRGTHENRRAITADQISSVSQRLDLWTGMLHSRFLLDDKPVSVTTSCDREADGIWVTVETEAELSICIDLPGAKAVWGRDPSDWSAGVRHSASGGTVDSMNRQWITHKLDDLQYKLWLGVSSGFPPFTNDSRGDNWLAGTYPLAVGKRCEFLVSFSPGGTFSSGGAVRSSARHEAASWPEFWQSGGAIDFAACTDPRARELERRVVLSQYLTAIQCSGDMPPQETGLTCNSWFGKPHLEMHWWHAAQFALWGRSELLERSMAWYAKTALPAARAIAKRQGYAGARWGKMVGPKAEESPSSVGEFLIWQQPHPIYYAELLFRAHPDKATLKKYQQIVFATADFMASYAHLNPATKQYDLGSPLIPAQEIYHATETKNPPFELSYWRFGLTVAQQWRARLGMAREAKWDAVLNNLAPLPSRDGVYINCENAPDTFTNAWNRTDHPAVVGALGIIPGPGVDKAMMARTLEAILKTWDWPSTWGWDYPNMAMTAARVERPDLAIDCLLMDAPKNKYLNNGHNYQDERLPLYLPGNGGLLAATAMMCAGWDGSAGDAPGFPKDGKWNVKWEGLRPMP